MNKNHKNHLIIITGMTLLVLVGILTLEQALAVNIQMTFHNLSNDYAMVELSDSPANCIVQPHQSCSLQTEPQDYTVSDCVTYCTSDNLLLYTEYSVYVNCDIYLNQTSSTNFTVTNSCPDKDKDNPKTQTLVLRLLQIIALM